ncbi:MAG: glutathione-regulated potassium-efflux system ancillary protein KefC [Desulforhopalus sp.]|jgi:glutathione-regulated potassium-efflux system ancillary protein KefC
MDPIILSIAFLLGFLCRQVRLPPMVGFLLTGFVLNGLGIQGGEVLETIADLGVTLLLFTIGLKLRLKSLARPEVWAVSSLHMGGITLVFGTGLYMLGRAGLPMLSPLSFPLALLIGFALSFSSTVFAVKILEEKAESSSLHGRVVIGILIMQDMFAVLFLTVSLGKNPALWAVLIPFTLILIRPLLCRLMEKSGHGELLVLFGLFVSIVIGAGGFETGDLKADLGALILGMLLAGHTKSPEVAKSLMGLKDLFLVGFFLTIGLSGIPDFLSIAIALLFVALVPLKGFLFYFLLTRFNLRARSSLLGTLALSNYSEFGLIVISVSVRNGWIGSEWLVIIAFALAISFVVAAPINTKSDVFYDMFRQGLKRFETDRRHPDDQPVDLGKATISIFGMGRIGTAAYEYMHERYGDIVLGFDFNSEVVNGHRKAGRNVVFGDPTDPDFWSRLQPNPNEIPRLAMLAMPKHSANIAAIMHLRNSGFSGLITAVGTFDDQVAELIRVGAKCAFNIYNEAGTGFAENVLSIMESNTETAQKKAPWMRQTPGHRS